MIHDRLEKLAKYTSIPSCGSIVAYLAAIDVRSLPNGDVPVSGEDLYVKVQRYYPKPASENYFETHRRHTDVQIMFEGAELMQMTHPSNLTDHTPYDEERDFQFYTAADDISSLILRRGEFVVFSPGEVHKPGCRHREPVGRVLKLVFKVRT